MLCAVIQYDHQGGATREMLMVLTGYKKSSRDTFLKKLRYYRLIELSGDRIVATEAGRDLGRARGYVQLPTGQKLREYWRDRLSAGEWTVLYKAIQSYPEPTSKEAIRASSGYSRSSIDTFVKRIRALQLVTTSSGTVRACNLLFEE